MSTTFMTEPITQVSPRSTARAAGFFWLITFLLGAFAMVSYERVVVSGNAAATAANILAHESFYRLGIGANVIATVSYLAATVLVYYLLKPVNRTVSLMAAFFSLTGCAISCLSFVFQLAPLVVLRGASFGSVFTKEQLQTLARMFLRLSEHASISFVFFGLHVFLIGVLILRSTFLNRIVGVLMLCGGLGWLTFAFANLLLPPLGRILSPYILFPGMLGEGSLIVWLLVKGVNVQRWQEQAGAAAASAIPEHT